MVMTPWSQNSRKRIGQISKARATARAYEAGTESPGGIIREIPAGEFKAKCLAIMDDVQQRGGAYVITKRGVPVAKLVPARIEPQPLLGSIKGSVATRGGRVRPLRANRGMRSRAGMMSGEAERALLLDTHIWLW